MKSFQDRLLKDFDVKQETGKNGKIRNVYVYKGKYACWDKPEEELPRYKRLHMSAGLVLMICFVWAALQRVPVNASKIGGLFTLCSFAALLFFAMGLYQFGRSPEKMYLRDCKLIRDRILWCGMIYCLLQAADAVTACVYLVKDGITVLGVLVMLAYAISAALALVIFLAQDKLGYRELEGEPDTKSGNGKITKMERKRA